MEKVTRENCIELIIKMFPKFIPYLESYITDFGSDLGLTIELIPFEEYTVDRIKTNDEIEIKKIFDFIECLLCNGDELVQNAITTAFLEYLLNKDPNEIKFSKFAKYLGENTVGYCKAWDRFTGVKTEGLWDSDYKWDLSKEDLNKMLRALDEITLYEVGKTNANDLLNSLEKFLEKLDLVDSRWKDDFTKDFNSLKHCSNVAGFRLIFVLEGEVKNNKEQGVIEHMKNMVNDLVFEYLKHPDPGIKKSAIVEHSTYLICSNCHNKWNSNLKTAMVICPSCKEVLQNSRFFKSCSPKND